jgi:alkylated DNA repair dioxygenase AlkB
MQQNLFTEEPAALDLPDADVRYYPDFIENSSVIYHALLEEITWQQDTIQMYGRPVLIPRMNAWYGDAEAHYGYSGLKLTPHSWTPSLLSLKVLVEEFLQQNFNSVLANYYRDANDSVAWHADDEPELGLKPVIASLSFGATRRFSLRRKSAGRAAPVHIELAPGSLLVMAGDTQKFWHHQLAKNNQPVAGRINLTYRLIAENNNGR